VGGTGVARPELSPDFFKGHGLGNDYLVFETGAAWRATAEALSSVCDRRTGVGSDGIVVVSGRNEGVWRLRMFNPDGGEFERSGNGLRVFGAWLRARGAKGSVDVEVGGERVVLDLGRGREGRGGPITVEMGRAALGPEAVGAARTKLGGGARPVHRLHGPLDVTFVSVGNPHAVLLGVDPEGEFLGEVGPWLETHSSLPRGVNVQVGRVEGPGALRIRIWERGVGETPASGTSACAAAAVAVHRKLLDPGLVAVRMPGGELTVEVSPALDLRLRGPVAEVATGRLTSAFLARLG